MIIQIYEIQTPHEAEVLLQAGVDHIGSVVVSEKNWKIPVIRETVQLVSQSFAKSCLIPLFTELDSIKRTLDYYQPDIIHFCDALPKEKNKLDKLLITQQSIKEAYPMLQIMRSVPIPEENHSNRHFSLELISLFEPLSDYFLTDTLLQNSQEKGKVEQPVEGFVGITGKTCDWNIARKLVETTQIPVILAGGISADNVLAGILQVKPFGIDSCTLTNKLDQNNKPIRFEKDITRVKKMIAEVRKAEK